MYRWLGGGNEKDSLVLMCPCMLALLVRSFFLIKQEEKRFFSSSSFQPKETLNGRRGRRNGKRKVRCGSPITCGIGFACLPACPDPRICICQGKCGKKAGCLATPKPCTLHLPMGPLVRSSKAPHSIRAIATGKRPFSHNNASQSLFKAVEPELTPI